jgi:hypothetical protein
MFVFIYNKKKRDYQRRNHLITELYSKKEFHVISFSSGCHKALFGSGEKKKVNVTPSKKKFSVTDDACRCAWLHY